MMTSDSLAKLRRSLILHEEERKFPYTDTVGKISIGIGYNLTDRGMSDEWINSQYQKDVTFFYNKLSEFPWYRDLTADRQIVLIDMSFMGLQRFREFTRMIDALAIHDYAQAAAEMLDSEWAKQVKTRAESLAHAMLTGVYDV